LLCDLNETIFLYTVRTCSPHWEWRMGVRLTETPQVLNKLSDQLKRQNVPSGNQDQPKFAALVNASGKAGLLKTPSSEVKALTPLTLEDYRNQAIRVRVKSLVSRVFTKSTESTNKDDPKAPEHIQKAIEGAARKFKLPTELVTAIIKVESNFNPRAVSSEGARGLMQLMPTTAEDLGVKNSFDIRENINGGCRYLKEMLGRFNGKLELALAAYNAGPGAVERYGKIPPYKETQDYVKKVLAHC
jgi:soluble lytic murein transglycosylase-like protein